MAHLNGTWIYQSFRPSAQPPAPMVRWSPAGKLSVATDASGKVDGKLTIPLPPGAPVPELVLSVSGSETSAKGSEGVELTAKGEAAVYRLQGYFKFGSGLESPETVIVGTVVADRNDLGKQPDGTSGPFLMFRG